VTQRFSGSWTITVKGVAPYPALRYVIAGSDDADGAHAVPFLGEHPPTVVHGGDWTLQIQYLADEATDCWMQDDAFPAVPGGGERSTAAFDIQHGLVRQVGTGSLAWDGPPPPGAFRFSGVRLVCTSQDPDLNPGPLPPHPDFTLPGARG